MRNKALPQPGSNVDIESVEPDGNYGNNVDNESFEPDGSPNRNNEPLYPDGQSDHGDPCDWAVSCESTEST